MKPNPIPFPPASSRHSSAAERGARPVTPSQCAGRAPQLEPFNSFTPMGAHIDALMKKVAPK